MADAAVRGGCITLIGMPACGKSSVGVVLAKKTGRQFIDGDLLIQGQTGKLLKELIQELGDEGFRALEEEINAGIQAERAVIAPGGSIVYGERAMRRFHELGQVVYLKLSYPTIRRRLGDLTARGVSIKPGQTLRQLYDERVRLYEKYADIVVDETGMNTRQVVEAIARAVGEALPEKKAETSTGSTGPRGRKTGKRKAAAGRAVSGGRTRSGRQQPQSSTGKGKRHGKRVVEAGQSSLSGSGSDGELRRQRRK